MRAIEETSTLQRFVIPVVVVIVIVVGAILFWLRKPPGQITCDIAADFNIHNPGDNERVEQIKKHLSDHFDQEPFLDVTFEDSSVGRITGRQEFTGKRKRSKLGKKLTGETMVEVATPEQYEALLIQHIKSLGKNLTPSHIGIHKVITEADLISTARRTLEQAFPGEVESQTSTDFLAKYTGADPQSFGDKVAQLGTGTAGRFVLGIQREQNREMLAVFLVEKESPLNSGHLQDIFQSEPENFVDEELTTPQFAFTFNEEGAELLYAYTAKHVGHRAAFIVNDFAQTVPVIQTAISGGSMLLTMGQGSNDSLGHRIVTSFRLARLGLHDVKFTINNAEVSCQ